MELTAGSTLTFTGNNINANNDCENDSYDQVWEAFTINETMNIAIDYCGTTPYIDGDNLGSGPAESIATCSGIAPVAIAISAIRARTLPALTACRQTTLNSYRPAHTISRCATATRRRWVITPFM